MAGRRRNTASFSTFKRNIGRAKAFLRLFDVDRTQGRPTKDENELLRAAVVFAVAALDAFLHDLVIEIVPRFGGDRSRLQDAFRAISKDDPGLSLRITLADEASRREEFQLALSDWLEKQSFQGVERVAHALQYCGCSLSILDFDRTPV